MFSDGVCSIVRSAILKGTSFKGYLESLDYPCRFQSSEKSYIIQQADTTYRHSSSSRHMEQVSDSAIPFRSFPKNQNLSLELTFAIMAACIPTLRPLFRFFDDGKAGDLQSSRRGFMRQSQTAQDRAFRSNQIPTGGTDYNLTTLEASQSDSRRERSTQTLRDCDTIRKTIDLSQC